MVTGRNFSLRSGPLASYSAHKAEIDAAVQRVLQSGWYIFGKEVTAFEEEFAGYIGTNFAVGVGSGTEALHLALLACGVGQGDEVITVSHTAVATVAAVELSGATPVLVDIDPATYTMDPKKIEAAVTPRTRAVLPVHLYGHPADMAPIRDIADRHGLYVIEDCAQSHGALYRGRKVGLWGHVAAFSFYPTKNLGAVGDGGMVVTSDPKLADSLRLLRQYGWRSRDDSLVPGTNSRLDEIQAAVLRVKLPYLDEDNQRRRALAAVYSAALEGTGVSLPREEGHVQHVYHLYVVQARDRQSLRDHLKSAGVDTQVHYPIPVHLQSAYRGRLAPEGSLPCTEQVMRQIVSLPIHPHLTEDDVRAVASLVAEWSAGRGGMRTENADGPSV